MLCTEIRKTYLLVMFQKQSAVIYKWVIYKVLLSIFAHYIIDDNTNEGKFSNQNIDEKNGNKHKIIYNYLSQHLFYEFSNH